MDKQLELAIRWYFDGVGCILRGDRQMATINFVASQAAFFAVMQKTKRAFHKWWDFSNWRF